MCGGWPIEESSDSDGRLLEVEGRGCPAGPHPICGAVKFPRFLLRDGSLIWMNMASFMVLMKLWVFLSVMEK